MNHLLILNDPPYGTERSYNGLRLAGALNKHDDTEVRYSCSATRSAARSPARRRRTATTTSSG